MNSGRTNKKDPVQSEAWVSPCNSIASKEVSLNNPEPCPMLLGLKNKYSLNPETILDIGAHYGAFCRECNIVWPESEVVMIEATREFEEKLKNLNWPRKNQCIISLLGDSNREVTFYKTPAEKIFDSTVNTGHSVYKEKSAQYSGNNFETEKRTMERLDQIFSTETAFDLVKLDTQGSEIDIIKGGVDLIKKAKILIVEVSLKTHNIGAPMADEVNLYLNRLGFEKMDDEVSNNKDGGWFWKPSGGRAQEDSVFVNFKNL